MQGSAALPALHSDVMVRPVPIMLWIVFCLPMVLANPGAAEDRGVAVRCVQPGGRTIITSLALCRQGGGVLLGGPSPLGRLAEHGRVITIDPPPSRQPSPSPQLAAVQALLAALGYEVDPIGGAVGQRTGEAIRQFQRSEGLSVTGEPDAELLQRIIAVLRRRPAADPHGSAGSAQDAADARVIIAGLEHQAREENRAMMDLVNRVLDAFDLSR